MGNNCIKLCYWYGLRKFVYNICPLKEIWSFSTGFFWILLHLIVSVSKTIYLITKFEWPYYTCETKNRLVIRKREVEGEAVGPPMSEDKGRCHVCISNLAGVGHKLKKNQMYRVKTLCRICKKHTCKDHLIATCEICREHQKKWKLKYIL